MLLGLVLLLIGLVGFGLGSYWDLRYTEFPDWLPYSIIILAVAVRGIFSFLMNDWWILMNSLAVGTVFLFFGLGLYFLKQWGDGDAWLLGALGFLFPESSGFVVKTFFSFPITILLNFMFVSLVYLVFYSILIGARNKKIAKKFRDNISGGKRRYAVFLSLFFGVCWGFALYAYVLLSVKISSLFSILMFPFVLTFILAFTNYAKIVETVLFKKKISAKDLKEGDVILDGKWKGLTDIDLKRIRKTKKDVWIKEGVRFAPVFLITMIISIFYGDLVFLFI